MRATLKRWCKRTRKRGGEKEKYDRRKTLKEEKKKIIY
jgi:hypothetical protein